MSSLLFDRLHVGVGQVLDLRSAQNAFSASNLANAYTPGFRAQYLRFDHILAAAVGREDELGMSRTDPRHVGGPDEDPGLLPIETVEPAPWVLDGNSVNPEQEQVRLTENALLYDAVAAGLSRRISLLRYAASDGRH